MFKLLITAKAKKQIKLITKLYERRAIAQIFEDIKEDPLVGKPLEDELTGQYSYTVRVYRILYKIDWNDKTVTILKADHRGVVYKK